jgi:transposase-like protein
VEEPLAERGLDISYETVRRWMLKFGPTFARNPRRLRPSVLVTDKLPSYGAAKRELGRSVRQEHGLRQNHRAENSHQLVRQVARTSAMLSPCPQRFITPSTCNAT